MLQRAWGVGKTVCIIDNNPSIGAACPTPMEAIGQMKVLVELGRVCDVCLVGYRLYGTNGEETAKVLRTEQLLRNIPIVFMCTAKQRKQITLPNVHFLYKPIKKEQLLTVVHMLCTSQPQQTPLTTVPEESMSIPDPTRRERSSPSPTPVTTPSPSISHSLRRTVSHNKIISSTLHDIEEEPPQSPPVVTKPLTAQELAQEPEDVKLEPSANTITNTTNPEPTTPVLDKHKHEVSSLDLTNVILPLHPRPPTPPPATSPTPSSPEAASTNGITPQEHPHPATPPPETPAPTTPPPEAPAPTPRKDTILLVEDNPINAKIASAVLRRHHFEVELAGNGQVALEKVKLTYANFQLILMDIHMPVMDGLTCARLVRQFEKEHNLPSIPIIALTADATTMHRAACLEAGCNEFMSKPLDYPLLIEILKKLSSGNL